MSKVPGDAGLHSDKLTGMPCLRHWNSTARAWGAAVRVTLALAVLMSRCTYADSTPAASGYLRTNFTDHDGLNSNIINAITQTKNGMLWIGTPDGLDRFDGHSFSRADTQGFLRLRSARTETSGRPPLRGFIDFARINWSGGGCFHPSPITWGKRTTMW